MGNADILFITWSLLFQLALIAHFALRKWAFNAYVTRWGWIFYTLAFPAAIVSIVLFGAGTDWPFWVGGFIVVAWAAYGAAVEYGRKVEWRNPMRWSIGGPYVMLYLATVMFYWWPVALLSRPLWYLYALLFLTATALNISSHRRSDRTKT
jgi:hypothetical protein